MKNLLVFYGELRCFETIIQLYEKYGWLDGYDIFVSAWDTSDGKNVEIEKIMKPLKNGEQIPKDLADMIKKRKAIFDEDIDRLYTKVSQTLDGKQIVSTKNLKDKVEAFAKASISDIEKTSFYKKIKGLGDRTTIAELNRIRRQLDELSYTPEFIGSTKRKEFNQIKQAIKDSFDETELKLATTARNLDTTVPAQKGAKVEGIDIIKEGRIGLQEAADALNLLEKTNKLYSSGIKRFDNVAVNQIMGLAKDGKICLKNKNPKYR